MNPKKYPQIHHTPKNIFFLKTPKNEIQYLTPKMVQAYVYINFGVKLPAHYFYITACIVTSHILSLLMRILYLS